MANSHALPPPPKLRDRRPAHAQDRARRLEEHPLAADRALSADQTAVMEAVESVVTGEVARATAEGAAHALMALTCAAEVAGHAHAITHSLQPARPGVGEDRTRTRGTHGSLRRGTGLATDLCDTVEFLFRKDLEDGSRRPKCERWCLVYHFESGEAPVPPVLPSLRPCRPLRRDSKVSVTRNGDTLTQ